MSRRECSGILAALPLAGATALLLARWLPIEFSYVENTLGIVSIATEERYPQQQESFWLVFSAVVTVALTWALAKKLAAARVALRAPVEALASGALLAVLWLPTPFAVMLALLLAAAAYALARRPAPRDEAAPPATEERPLVAFRELAWTALACLALALVLTPTFWISATHVAIGLPDERRTVDGFVFQGEIGQHLAWANALLHGRFHGKDFFCLYGPFFDLGGVGAWKLFGRSIVAWELYFATTRVLGLTALLLLGAVLLRRRAWLLLLPFLAPWVNLRSGWACIGLVLMHGWLRSGRLGWMLAAGVTGGFSILYSQEFGLAFALTTTLVLLLHRALRAAVVFASGFAGVVVPVLAWYAANDALAAMLADLAGYPGYIVAGYAKLAFPNLAAAIPLDVAAWGTRELLPFQLGYGIPAIGLGAFLLALPVTRLRLRGMRVSLGELLQGLRGDPERTLVLATAVFGLLSFRAALGRSDLVHMIAVLPAAALLATVACDRVFALWRQGRGQRALAVWRSAAAALLLVHVGFPLVATPLVNARESFAWLAEPTRWASRQAGHPQVNLVTRWIREHTGPEDAVLFLPNDGAYYYLTDRPNPIRFVMGHQIVTEAHRQETLARLRSGPPAYVVWDEGALRVDGLSDEQVFGTELLAWIRATYEPEKRIGRVEILRPRRR